MNLLDIINTLIINSVSFKGILTWLTEEGSALILIAVIIGLIISIFKGAFKLAVIILIVGGLFYYIVGSPEMAMKSVADLWAKAIN